MRMTRQLWDSIVDCSLEGYSLDKICIDLEIDKEWLNKWGSKPENKFKFNLIGKNVNKMLRVAEKNIFQKILEGDVKTSKWFLEKRDIEYRNERNTTIEKISDNSFKIVFTDDI